MSQMRVLVVDDEEEFVFTLVERLELRGIKAEGTTQGSEAIKRLQSRDFDVVLLDVKMPGIGGLEVIKKIKAERPQVQVILLTGHGSPEDVREGMASKAFDYLMKPVNIDDLIVILQNAANAREKKSETEVKDNRRLHEKGLAFMGMITASLSHEINNVITVINELSGLLDDLLKGAESGRPIENERLDAISQKISNQIKRGEMFVKLLNRFSHSVDEPIASFGIKELLEEITALCQRFAALKKTRLETNFSVENFAVVSSPFILQHAIYLCVETALEAARDVKLISIDFEKQESGCLIKIKSADAVQKTDKVQRTLSLILQLLEEWGGKVELIPYGDVGHTFTILLPFSPPDRPTGIKG